jgi:uncharacterized membrane protein
MRVRAFDWLRGIAVLVMIQTHSLVLLRPELRQGALFSVLQWIDGLVAPSFIFAAGFALALVQVRSAQQASSSRLRRLRRTLRRLGEVFFVATLTNWMWFPIFREPRWILRVDILHCIGLALLIALPAMFLLATRPRALRWVALALAALVFGLAPFGEQVRGPLAMLANGSTGAVFPLLPWAGYVYLGAAIGATQAVGGTSSTVRWLIGIALGGIVLWIFSDRVAALYPPHQFWVTDPANSARRWTQVCLVSLALIGAEHLPQTKWRASAPVRFIEVFGTSSLAGYFLHEMLLYFRIFGFSFQRLWGDSSSWGQYWALLLLLIAMTFALTVLVDRIYRRVDGWLSAPSRSSWSIAR